MLPLPPQFLHPAGLSRAVALLDEIKNGVEHKQVRHWRLETFTSLERCSPLPSGEVELSLWWDDLTTKSVLLLRVWFVAVEGRPRGITDVCKLQSILVSIEWTKRGTMMISFFFININIYQYNPRLVCPPRVVSQSIHLISNLPLLTF